MPTIPLVLALLIAPPDPSASVQASADRRLGPPRIGTSVAYFGDWFVHPGGIAAVDLHLTRSPRHGFIVAGNLGGFRHPGASGNILVYPEAGYRFNARFGLMLEALVGAGLQYTWITQPVLVLEDGEYREVRDRGRPLGFASGLVGLGWRLNRKGRFPIRPFLRGQVYGRFPVNRRFIPNLGAQAGIAVELGSRSR